MRIARAMLGTWFALACASCGGSDADGPCEEGLLDGDGFAGTREELERLRGCRIIDGDLFVTGSVSHLAPLAALEEVRGNLYLNQEEGGLSGLVDLEGLNRLAVVERDFSINQAPDLVSLAGVNSLSTVGDLHIHGCPGLETLDGLDSLTDVEMDLTILANPRLTELDGFPALEHVGRILSISHNEAMARVSGLAALASVETIELHGDPLLQEVPGLHRALTVAAPHLSLARVPALDLFELPALSSLSGLTLIAVDQAADLSFVSGIVELGGLGLSLNANLVSLAGLEGLTSLGGLGLGNNPRLLDLSALAGVEAVDGDLRLSGPPDGLDLAGLAALRTIGGELGVSRGEAMRILAAPPMLRTVGSIGVIENQGLQSLTPFPSLETVERDVRIHGNAPIDSQQAAAWLDGVTVGGTVKIGTNAGEPAFDPCPWAGDGECDTPHLCASGTEDLEDCPPIE